MPIIHEKLKDYHIIRIRYMCDDTKLYHKKDSVAVKQHWKRAQDYNEFFWNLFNRVCGYNMKEYNLKYMFYAMECAKEEFFDKNIYISLHRDAEYEYLIPKKRQDLYDILMEELSKYDLPFRIGKHTYINWLSCEFYRRKQDPKYRRYHRDMALQFMKKSKVLKKLKNIT